MTVIEMRELDEEGRLESARILVDAFAHAPGAWSTLDEGREQVAKTLSADDRLGFAAMNGGGVAGWIGAIRHSEHQWELHPLVVDPPRQRSGIGTRLVASLEAEGRRCGVQIMWLGTDDDFGGTSLFGRDLYPDPLAALARIEPAAGHPFTFYRKLGYALCGVIPDATGPGRPDILMAKRVGAAL